MATRRALVNINGQTQELPAGDDLAGAGTFSGPLVFNGILTPPQITADQNNYSPTNFHLYNVLRLDVDANREITGIDSTNVVAGQSFILVNISQFNIKLKNNNTNSLAQNRFLLKADITLEKEEAAIVWYDTTSQRWRIAAANV